MIIFVTWMLLTVFDILSLWMLIHSDRSGHNLIISMKTNFFLFFDIIWPFDAFLSFLFRLFDLFLRNQSNLILQELANRSCSVMGIHLEKNISDIFEDVIFDGFNTSRMLSHKITKIKHFIFKKHIILTVFFTLIYPFINRFFFHERVTHKIEDRE